MGYARKEEYDPKGEQMTQQITEAANAVDPHAEHDHIDVHVHLPDPIQVEVDTILSLTAGEWGIIAIIICTIVPGIIYVVRLLRAREKRRRESRPPFGDKSRK